MTRDDMNIFEEIERKYKSLKEPDFSFVGEAISSRPYNELMDCLKGLFRIEEITDSNDDVSFRYVLSKSGKQWMIELSMVGLYATMLRLPEVGFSELVPFGGEVREEKEIYLLLCKYEFNVLRKRELEESISLNLCNTEPGNVRLYQALFSDTDMLPWVS